MDRPAFHFLRFRASASVLFTLVFIMLVAGICRAQDAARSNAAPTDAIAESTATTNGVDGTRDPFWPVGYEPEPPEVATAQEYAAAQAAEKDVIEWPALQLRGLTRTHDGSYLALIHGLGWVETGDTVKCVNKNIVYKWIVKDVGEGGVRCDRISATPLSEINRRSATDDEPAPLSEQ